MRRDASGASGQVTAKPAICGWGAFCPTGTSVGRKSGVYAVSNVSYPGRSAGLLALASEPTPTARRDPVPIAYSTP